ncbi:hypothetical protein [Paraburkholderia fungorum]|uniref:Uncharacterized protein n=1 Tax=Paraburkholderia fungorum TaxID=134537 RepID=A0A420G1R1_9BURK|nr:hypothetical protein [Paraburkholderia fungorum]RKF39103.1 hypothetical protein BCY88_33645 [Paraburkholderia fungorum]
MKISKPTKALNKIEKVKELWFGLNGLPVISELIELSVRQSSSFANAEGHTDIRLATMCIFSLFLG